MCVMINHVRAYISASLCTVMLKVGTGAHMCYVALPVSMCVTLRGISVKGGE